VTQAAKRGPRTSTWAGVFWLVDMYLLLLLIGLDGDKPQTAAPEWRRGRKARLLSSYSDNSSSPRRGTDRLRDAW
jgi:hypothetical protein